MKIIILIIILLLFAFIYITRVKKKDKNDKVNKSAIKNKWGEIEKLAKFDEEMYYKIAIIEADKLLDSVFKQMGTPGSTMAERLRFLIYKYPKLKSVWEAHSIRNNVSHDSDYILYKSLAKKALSIYKSALKELNIL
ncbi:MAG TPA: hypothetical protein PLM63_00440 [bacterium]|nr:hypothetical protein [bacterium]HPO11044.1 hypothetical protein [bacterium]HQL11703.1 hypothetical protein [bacterium]